MTDILAGQLQQIVRELTQSDVDENRTDYIYHMLDQINRRISHIFGTDEDVELLTQIHHLLVSIETEIFGQANITANFGITTLSVRGRPKFKVNMDQVMYLLSHGFKCPQISSLLGISLRTLRRRMSDDNISVSNCFVDMSNEELDLFLESNIEDYQAISCARVIISAVIKLLNHYVELILSISLKDGSKAQIGKVRYPLETGDNHVMIPESNIVLTDEVTKRIGNINPLQESNNFGIDIYLEMRQIISDVFHN